MPDDEEELERFAAETASKLADHFQALVNVLNEFLGATTAAESGRLLEQHPELLGEQADRIMAKIIQDALSAKDAEAVSHLRERRNYLDQYRRLAGGSLAQGGSTKPAAECAGDEHSWAISYVSRPDHQGTAVRCERCHAGYLLEMRPAPDGAARIDYFVFPADGYDTISREVTMWAVMMCEGFISQMKQDGTQVIRGTPVLGLRPESLALYTDFTPLR
jgi:hypothetical protein